MIAKILPVVENSVQLASNKKYLRFNTLCGLGRFVCLVVISTQSDMSFFWQAAP
jgi:hypothetical protein